jgi:UDP-glucose 4-epimerase
VKVTILGASGYIGKQLCAHLTANGHSVLGLGRTPPATWWQKTTLPAGTRYFQHDFLDTERLPAELFQSDLIIHCISSSTPTTAEHIGSRDIEHNLIPTIKFAERNNSINNTRLIFISSGGTVYGNSIKPAKEFKTHLSPISQYGITKLSIEKYLTHNAMKHSTQLHILRLSNLFGPITQEESFGIISHLVKTVMNDTLFSIWGDGKQIRDYIHISDFLSFIDCVIADTQITQSVINVGSGKGHKTSDIIYCVEKALKKSANITFLEERKFDVKKIVLDISYAQHRYNWFPKIQTKDGIRLVVNNFLLAKEL